MKSYTDLEQSKKLAEIFPLESADMYYRSNGIDVKLMWEHNTQKVTNPCWSLSALLDILPKHIGGSVLRIDMSENDFNLWFDDLSGIVDENLPDITKDNPIDACYEMILKLHEQKLL